MTVRVADANDIDAVVETITLASRDDPVWASPFPSLDRAAMLAPGVPRKPHGAVGAPGGLVRPGERQIVRCRQSAIKKVDEGP